MTIRASTRATNKKHTRTDKTITKVEEEAELSVAEAAAVDMYACTTVVVGVRFAVGALEARVLVSVREVGETPDVEVAILVDTREVVEMVIEESVGEVIARLVVIVDVVVVMEAGLVVEAVVVEKVG
jgi:hypothetical protein